MRYRRFGGGLVVLALLPVLNGCGTSRSVESFCSTYHAEKQAFQQAHPAAGGAAGPDRALLGMASALQSVGDAAVVFDKLERVAPDDIDPDVVVVRDSWKKITDSFGEQAADPGAMFGILAQNLMTSAQTSGSWQRVGDYITENCGA